MKRYSRCLIVLVFAIAVSLVSMSGVLADGCRFVHMIDPDNHWVQVFPVGSTIEFDRYDLRDGGSNELTDIAFTTVPVSNESVSFVTQGHYLRLIDHNNEGLIGTIDVGELTGLENLTLEGVAAAERMNVSLPGGGEEDQYALYLAGGASGKPYYIVLDQEAVLDGAPESEMLIASGELCVDGLACRGAVVDIAVGSTSKNAGDQFAFVSVLGWDEQNNRQQQFFRVDREGGADGPFSVTLEPWQRGVTWGGTRHRSLGVDISSDGDLVAGVFQTEGEWRDLESGSSSCILDGEPTDIVFWGPGTDPSSKLMQFVTYDDDEGSTLAASTWMTCADPSDPLSDVRFAPGRATAVILSSRSETRFWVYTAGRDDAVQGFEYEIVQEGEEGHEWALHRLGDVKLADPDDCEPEGKAIRLAIGAVDPTFASCPNTPICPKKPAPPIPCCLDPQDPDPICDDCIPPDSGDGDVGGGGDDGLGWRH